MKLLLDECVPKRLKYRMSGHDVVTVVEAGWSGIKNGKLLSLADTRFDVFITVDSKLPYQQNLANRSIAVIVILAIDNTYDTLLPIVPEVLLAISTIKPGDALVLEAPTTS